MINIITIQFDGGCANNPGNKYGSFEVKHQIESRPPKQLVLKSRFPLGYGTNNEAEFESLLAGLEWTTEALEAGGFLKKDFTVRMVTDSTVVGFRITGTNTSNKGEPQQRMFALNARCLKHLIPFQRYWIDVVPRQLNVALFGH